MRAVVQRVVSGGVTIEGREKCSIAEGLVVLLAVHREDTTRDAAWLAGKIAGLRIFSDAEGKMNLSLLDTAKEMLVISQFTLYAECEKGLRPSFSQAAPPQLADSLYEEFVRLVKELGVRVETGVFQADMLVKIDNDGPVTVIIDSKNGKAKK